MIQGQSNNEYRYTRNHAPTKTGNDYNTFSHIVAVKENLLKPDGTHYSMSEARNFLLSKIEVEDIATLELIACLAAG